MLKEHVIIILYIFCIFIEKTFCFSCLPTPKERCAKVSLVIQIFNNIDEIPFQRPPCCNSGFVTRGPCDDCFRGCAATIGDRCRVHDRVTYDWNRENEFMVGIFCAPGLICKTGDPEPEKPLVPGQQVFRLSIPIDPTYHTLI